MKRCSIDGSDDRGGYGVVAQKSKMQRSIRGGVEKVAELGEDLALAQAGGFWGGRRPCAGSGVSWRRTSAWEAMCTRDWVKVPCGIQQLRAVVLALGGFRRLHSLYTLPFLSSSSRRPGAAPLPLSLTSAAAAPSTMTWRPHLQPRWGKDEEAGILVARKTRTKEELRAVGAPRRKRSACRLLLSSCQLVFWRTEGGDGVCSSRIGFQCFGR